MRDTWLFPVKSLHQKAILFCATGAGAGYFPRMPGTMGTVVAIPFSLGLNWIATSHFWLALFILIAAIVFAIWSADEAAKILKQKDPQRVVIDEIVGFLLANFLMPPSAAALLGSFVLFRFFDIAKIFPIDRIERLPGGAGIVLDDVMAGFYALMCLRVISGFGWL